MCHWQVLPYFYIPYDDDLPMEAAEARAWLGNLSRGIELAMQIGAPVSARRHTALVHAFGTDLRQPVHGTACTTQPLWPETQHHTMTKRQVHTGKCAKAAEGVWRNAGPRAPLLRIPC